MECLSIQSTSEFYGLFIRRFWRNRCSESRHIVLFSIFTTSAEFPVSVGDVLGDNLPVGTVTVAGADGRRDEDRGAA